MKFDVAMNYEALKYLEKIWIEKIESDFAAPPACGTDEEKQACKNNLLARVSGFMMILAQLLDEKKK